MPQASGASLKYAWMDHPPAFIAQPDPDQNQWYEIYHDYDVRQILMDVCYYDDEMTGADIEIRWTIDGNVYLGAIEADDLLQYYVYKNKYGVDGPTQLDTTRFTDTGVPLYHDKRGLDFRVEARITTAHGTNSVLLCHAVYETLEVT